MDDDDKYGVDPDWERKEREAHARLPKVACKYCTKQTTNIGYGYCHSCYNLRSSLESACNDGSIRFLEQMLKEILPLAKRSY